MKRLCLIALSILMTFSLVSCKGDENDNLDSSTLDNLSRGIYYINFPEDIDGYPRWLEIKKLKYEKSKLYVTDGHIVHSDGEARPSNRNAADVINKVDKLRLKQFADVTVLDENKSVNLIANQDMTMLSDSRQQSYFSDPYGFNDTVFALVTKQFQNADLSFSFQGLDQIVTLSETPNLYEIVFNVTRFRPQKIDVKSAYIMSRGAIGSVIEDVLAPEILDTKSYVELETLLDDAYALNNLNLLGVEKHYKRLIMSGGSENMIDSIQLTFVKPINRSNYREILLWFEGAGVEQTLMYYEVITSGRYNVVGFERDVAISVMDAYLRYYN